MAHKKAGGSAKNLTDSKPKFLGVKLGDGQSAKIGNVIVRQRGTKFVAGLNTAVGRDHTIFAMADGIVTFKDKRKVTFTGEKVVRKEVNVK